MAKSNNQKAKILYLEQLLCQTGEHNTISMQTILSILEEHDIRAERKSIYDDFEVLRSFGMDIRYRRGRNGGYYLVNDVANADITEQNINRNVITNLQPAVQERVDTQEQAASFEWKAELSSSTKQMKLLVDELVKDDVQKFFGKQVQYKESEGELLLAVVPAMDDPQFFGWLTAMGKMVHIVKPKKIAQAYRDYLKTLAKEYKGI